MDKLYLSETLQRYFFDLFLCLDEGKTGKVDVNKLIEVFRVSNIPEDIVKQIGEICWSTNQSLLNRKQFCSALKLVATFQSNVPIREEVLSSSVELSLPRLTLPLLEPVDDLLELNNSLSIDETLSTDSEVESETLNEHNGSPSGASSAASESPTPTNSVQDRSWAITNSTWQGLVSEEQRQLLGTEEESSDRHSSEEDTEVSNEVWTITAEQRDYYTKQFLTLQPDTNALVAGPVARMFFEKSRLPVQELRKIWQLADVTKDGALSLEEFNTAMHLVVLRRNHIELPDTLPPQLVPGSETSQSVTPETEPILSPQSQTKESAKEWTKFVDSPTNSVSSPGPKPVNFDFQKGAVEKDPKILHPVALRLTPEVASLSDEGVSDDGSKKNDENRNSTAAIQRPQAKKFNLPGGPGIIPPPPTEGPVSLPAFPPPKKEKPPPPPPRPFKTHGRSSSLDLNKLNKNLAPPSVPPRVSPNPNAKKQLVNQRSEGDYGGKQTQQEFQANFDDHFEKYENVAEDEIFPGDKYEAERKKLFSQYLNPTEDVDGPRKHGAFEVYRKPVKSPMAPEDQAKYDLFLKLQEQNTVLLRLCQELSQELADVKEEKHLLKLRLEKQQASS